MYGQQIDLEGRVGETVAPDGVIPHVASNGVQINTPNDVTAPAVVVPATATPTVPAWLLGLLALGAWITLR